MCERFHARRNMGICPRPICLSRLHSHCSYSGRNGWYHVGFLWKMFSSQTCNHRDLWQLSFYVHKSRRLNAHHFAHQKVAIVGENICKMKDLWEFYGCPTVELAYTKQRATFLDCLPSILSVPIVLLQGHVPITDFLREFQDYLPHVTQEDHENVEAILKVCNDYAECKTFILRRMKSVG